jgi:uncharacterized protein YegL
MADVRGHLLPVYVIADESGSMEEHEGELNKGLASLHNALRGEPMVAAKVRLTVLGFASRVAVRLALSDLREQPEAPKLHIGGTTSYQSVFEELLGRIPADVRALKSQGYLVHRPAVFFLSDGQPNPGEDWVSPHKRLTDRTVTSAAPNVIAFGVGAVDAATILQVATEQRFAFVSVPGADIGTAITKFFLTLTASVIQSGQSLNSAAPEIVIDRPDPDQFRMAIEVV